MAEQSAQDRTEKATPRRQEKEREKGQIPKSQDLISVTVLFAGVLAFYFNSDNIMGNITKFIIHVYSEASFISISTTSLPMQISFTIKYIIPILAPIPLFIMSASIVINLAQDNFKIIFAKKALKPKFSALNPIQGIKKIFSLSSLVELVKGILKFIIVGFIAYSVLKKHLELNEFWILYNVTVAETLVFFGKLLFELSVKVGAVLLVLGIADFAYQKWQHEKKIKMSKQEVKDERKQYEGSPELKGRIRSIQLQVARRRMMSAVPDATVVVTNPTFIAVAIKYEPIKNTDAPVVVAKGKRKIAEKIREIASLNNIPIIENKPLAKSLFDTTEVGMEISMALYQAVAEILAQVYKMNQKLIPVT